MKDLIKTFLFAGLFLLLLTGVVLSQVKSADTTSGKTVKWEIMGGKNNEFLLYMPQGFETISDGDFITGKPGAGGTVDRKLTVYRYINGVLLTMEYFEGDAKTIQKNLQEREKLTSDKSELINGFEFKEFSGTAENYFTKIQHFRIKNRLYVLKAIAKSGDNPIVDGFFKSVKLVADKKAVSPNFPAGTAAVALPGIVEQEAAKIGNEAAIESKQADRKVIVLYAARPKYPRGQANGGGKIKLRILYSASGKISNVEVLESPSKALSDAAVEAARKSVFIPAEKDGKLISVYQTREYSFEIR